MGIVPVEKDVVDALQAEDPSLATQSRRPANVAIGVVPARSTHRSTATRDVRDVR
jgi:hypothetical protein